MTDSAGVPDALLFITPGCPHCHGVLTALGDLVKQGVIGALEVVNAAVRPQRAAALGVRGAPWVRIGPFTLEGAQTPAALRTWAGRAAVGDGAGGTVYLQELLASGRLGDAELYLRAQPQRLALVLPLVEDTALPMQVRVGAGALFESWAATAELAALVPELGRLSSHTDHRIRSDACHYLGLSGSPAALPFLKTRLGDIHPEVREIAADSLAAIAAHGA